ncbi:MAG: hypothetical protein OHK0038_07540 [Flammeovirgaceae bacterium]
MAAQSPYIAKIWEYKPAAGQFINSSAWGTPQKAESLVGGLEGGISLGSLGGYIVVGFEKPIENEENNPYGIDFTIFGNASKEIAEPAIVWVMKDENNNQKPDDIWYELAGSEHFFQSTLKKTVITYQNPQKNFASDVYWFDNHGESGFILANQYHTQPYYPLANIFASYPQNQVSFQVTKLKNRLVFNAQNNVSILPFAFGYADNTPKNLNQSTLLPDNPYTAELEGMGGDAMDISWAIDEKGESIFLDKIHFVKIQTACLGNAGWLGEISTEITGIVDISPNENVVGETKTFVLNSIPAQMKIGESFLCEAILFDKGKPVGLPSQQIIEWQVDNPEIANIQPNGLLKVMAGGEFTVSAKYQGFTATKKIFVPVPSAIEINLPPTWQIKQKYDLKAYVKDARGNLLTDFQTEWLSDNSDVVFIKKEGETWTAEAINEGSCNLSARLTEFPHIQKVISIKVVKEILPIPIYISVVTPTQTLYEQQKIEVKALNLNFWVENPKNDYDISGFQSLTLAHAVAALMYSQMNEEYFALKQSSENQSLYISKIKQTTGQTTFEYNGFGGEQSQGKSKAWGIIYKNKLYVDSLEYVQIKENELVILCYLPDITQKNEFYFWTSNQVQGSLGEVFLLQLWNGKTFLNAQKKLEFELQAVPNADFLVNNELYFQDNQLVKTNESGIVLLSFSQQNWYKITYQNASIQLKVGDITNSETNTYNEVIIYPNPSSNFIKIEGIGKNEIEININNIIGENVINAKVKNNSVLDISNLPNGIYFLEIENHVKPLKIVVRK